MNIVVLDKFLGKVYYVEVDNELVKNGDVEQWLKDRGYDPKDYPYMRNENAEYVPIELCRFALHKVDGKEIRESCNERLRFGSPFHRVKDLKRREQEECAEALKKHGIEEDGGYEKYFEAEKPIVAGYMYDEPCDIVVNAVSVKDNDIYILGYDKEDPYDEQEIPADELFAGQLNEITERI